MLLSGTLFDSSVEITRLTMKVVRGPRGLRQARPEPHVTWNGRWRNHTAMEERDQTAAYWTLYHRWPAPAEDHSEVQKEAPSSGQEGGDGRQPCDDEPVK